MNADEFVLDISVSASSRAKINFLNFSVVLLLTNWRWSIETLQAQIKTVITEKVSLNAGIGQYQWNFYCVSVDQDADPMDQVPNINFQFSASNRLFKLENVDEDLKRGSQTGIY